MSILKPKKSALYLLPLIIAIFLITYHYYKFYQDDFKANIAFSNSTFPNNNYEKIQEQHPYYQIFKLSQKVKNPEKIVYLRTRRDPKNPSHLHELQLMVNYFFYPAYIHDHTLKEFNKLSLKKGNIIISDLDLTFLTKTDLRVKQLWFPGMKLHRINRKPEDYYYTYIVN